MKCERASIINRIVCDDCTILESDFYPPQDNRQFWPENENDMERHERYEYFKDFNELCEMEELYD